MIIKLQISDPIWWGYNELFNLDNYHNKQTLINDFLNSLEVVLESLNMLPQKEFLQKVKKDFHIHNLSFEDILLLKENEIVYVCRHDNTENDEIKIN